MTRREWFMQLGAGVVLSGCSALDLDAAELPPGVYEPSRDHLSHALAGRGLAAGSETELTPEFQPTFFRPDEYLALRELIALLLGENPVPIIDEIGMWISLTVGESPAVRKAALALVPAHRTLAVHYYGEKAVRELEELDPQSNLPRGSGVVRSRKVTRSYLRRSARTPHGERRHAILHLFESRVIEGFYTSRTGLEELGRGNPNFHASPPGCTSEFPVHP
jgi:hypothetical protein